jgi:hypothetical protein
MASSEISISWDQVKQYASVTAFIQAEHHGVVTAAQLRGLAEAEVISQSTRFALLHYRKSEVTDQWGEAGKEQNQQSFVRTLLKLPADTNIHYHDFQQFQETLHTQYEVFGILDVPESDLQGTLENYRF